MSAKISSPRFWVTSEDYESKRGEFFWKRVKIAGTDECWIFGSGKDDGEYGQFRWKGRLFGAHRISYMLAYGSIPAGMLVCHICDVPKCVNPKHLFAGTPQDNVDDCIKKGRFPIHPKGESGSSKLTWEMVADIRKSLSEHSALQRELASKYGIAQSQVSRINTGTRW